MQFIHTHTGYINHLNLRISFKLQTHNIKVTHQIKCRLLDLGLIPALTSVFLKFIPKTWSFPLLKLPGWPGQLQKFPFALTGLCWLGFGEGPTTLQNRLTPLGPRTQWAFGSYCTLSLAATQGALGDYSHVTERESKA